jgi:hypothetical protein
MAAPAELFFEVVCTGHKVIFRLQLRHLAYITYRGMIMKIEEVETNLIDVGSCILPNED